MNEDIFEAVQVTLAEAHKAYRLVALSRPEVSLSEWKRYLRQVVQPRHSESGVVALRDRRGCIHGLFAFRVVQALGCDPTLQVTELAVLRLPGTVLLEALLRFAGDLAGGLRLPAIALDMQPSAAWGQDCKLLEMSGFALDRIMMRSQANSRGARPVKA